MRQIDKAELEALMRQQREQAPETTGGQELKILDPSEEQDEFQKQYDAAKAQAQREMPSMAEMAERQRLAEEQAARDAKPVDPDIELQASEQTSRSGLRYRELVIALHVRTHWNFEGRIVQENKFLQMVQKRTMDVYEEQANSALRSLGWVPPAGVRTMQKEARRKVLAEVALKLKAIAVTKEDDAIETLTALVDWINDEAIKLKEQG